MSYGAIDEEELSALGEANPQRPIKYRAASHTRSLLALFGSIAVISMFALGMISYSSTKGTQEEDFSISQSGDSAKTSFSTVFTSSEAIQFQISPSFNFGVAVASGSKDIYYFFDDPTSWIVSETALSPDGSMFAVGVSEEGNAVLVTDSSVLYTGDNGAHWMASSSFSSDDISALFDAAGTTVAVGSKLSFLTARNSVFRSVDNGVTWAETFAFPHSSISRQRIATDPSGEYAMLVDYVESEDVSYMYYFDNDQQTFKAYGTESGAVTGLSYGDNQKFYVVIDERSYVASPVASSDLTITGITTAFSLPSSCENLEVSGGGSTMLCRSGSTLYYTVNAGFSWSTVADALLTACSSLSDEMMAFCSYEETKSDGSTTHGLYSFIVGS